MIAEAQKIDKFLTFLTSGFCIAIAAIVADMRSASADNAEAIRQAHSTIDIYSQSICTKWEKETRSSRVKASGEANVGLKGLLRNLADMGISFATQYESQEAFGPLQSDLAQAVVASDQCKLEVMKFLLPRLVPSPGTDKPVVPPQLNPSIINPPQDSKSATLDDLPLIHRVPASTLLLTPNYFGPTGNDFSSPYEFQAYKEKMQILGRKYVNQINDALEEMSRGDKANLNPLSSTLLEMSRSAEFLLHKAEGLPPFDSTKSYYVITALHEVGTFSTDYVSRLQALDRAYQECEQYGNIMAGNAAQSYIVSYVAGCQAHSLGLEGTNLWAAEQTTKAITTLRTAAEKARRHIDNPLMEAQMLTKIAFIQAQSNCSESQKTVNELVKVLNKTGNGDRYEAIKQDLSKFCNIL